MTTRYDDDDRYDERDEDLSARPDDYERNRFERGSYGASRYNAGRDYDRPDYRRDYNRTANMRDPGYERQERYAGYERDYGRDYDRDYDRKFGYGRDTARDYGRGARNARDYGRDYERDERDYYNARSPRNYDRGPYGYNYNERRNDWSLRRGAREAERPAREMRGRERGWWDRVTDEVASWFGDEEAERRRLGDGRQRNVNHRGRGPRNYRRSDERISEDINDRLTEHPYLDASDIEVIVDGGEVTLNGSVESRQAKRLTEDIAESVAGVTNVENRLRVTQGASDTVNETTTATETTTTDATTEPTKSTTSTSAAAGASGTGRSKTT